MAIFTALQLLKSIILAKSYMGMAFYRFLKSISHLFTNVIILELLWRIFCFYSFKVITAVNVFVLSGIPWNKPLRTCLKLVIEVMGQMVNYKKVNQGSTS
jgi:hypothetical protein